MTATLRWQLAAIALALGVLLYLLGPVLTPFAVAALLAYLGDPVVDRLEARGLNRGGAVAVVFALMTLVMLLIPIIVLPLLERQISTLVERLPEYIGYIRDQLMPLLQERLGLDPDQFSTDAIIAGLKNHWQQAGGIAATVLASISQSGMMLLVWITNLLLIPVVTFYFLRDWDLMLARLRELLPRHIEAEVMRVARESDEVLGAFLRGQLMVMLILGLIYSIGLWLAGIKLAFLIGMSAGLLSFVPYLGAALGVGGAVIAALVEHRDVIHVVYVLAVFGVGQTLESFLLTPWLVGDKIGMHPVAVIFAILVGGQLFGFLGILLALPVAAVLMVVLRHVHERYVRSELYGPSDPNAGPQAGDAVGSEPGAAKAETLPLATDSPPSTQPVTAGLGHVAPVFPVAPAPPPRPRKPRKRS